ncbi:TPA: hypothetical protein HA251_00440 [Candidatus Woesearchaeota archaeon]|nr:hypothetical protein [Candidatus Woesearchaeota archaeon]
MPDYRHGRSRRQSHKDCVTKAPPQQARIGDMHKSHPIDELNIPVCNAASTVNC